jgi:hypothetical protein
MSGSAAHGLPALEGREILADATAHHRVQARNAFVSAPTLCRSAASDAHDGRESPAPFRAARRRQWVAVRSAGRGDCDRCHYPVLDSLGQQCTTARLALQPRADLLERSLARSTNVFCLWEKDDPSQLGARRDSALAIEADNPEIV